MHYLKHLILIIYYFNFKIISITLIEINPYNLTIINYIIDEESFNISIKYIK